MIEKYELLNRKRRQQSPQKRVAAYCRVSTDSDDQANSFESQKSFFLRYIAENPDWELFRIFADEGISGTSTKKRMQFNAMIECAKNGQLDLIITKEISRFARNTLDSIYFTRELKKFGVGVIFLTDGINTLDGDAELRLAIMSSIAQEESRRTSERVKWGQKRRMEEGVVFGRSMLGYDVKNGNISVNAEGAQVVRMIFRMFVLEGKSTYEIAREIQGCCRRKWSNTAVLRILRNEKYCGDLVQKKTYTPDFLTHEKKCNHGQEEFVTIRDHHEPIIPRELFEEADRILQRRSIQSGMPKNSRKYPLSGKIFCGICGSKCVARCRSIGDGTPLISWRCTAAIRKKCPAKSIRSETALQILRLACNALCDTGQSLKILQNALAIAAPNLHIDLAYYNRKACPTLLDKMVVHDPAHVDVFLKGIPIPLKFSEK